MEIKTYAFSVDTDELFDSLTDNRIQPLTDYMTEKKGFVGVHPSPMGTRYYFLFLTPQARNECFDEAKRQGYNTAFCCLTPAFVNVDDLK